VVEPSREMSRKELLRKMTRVTHLAQGHIPKSLRRQERRRLHPRRAVLLPKWRVVRKTPEVRQKKDTSGGLKMTLTLTLGASQQISAFCVIQDRVVTFLLSWTRMARLKTCRLRAVPRHGPTKTQVLLTFSSSTKDYGLAPRCLIC